MKQVEANFLIEVRQLQESSFLNKLRLRTLKKQDPSIKLAYRCLLEHFESMLSEEPVAWEGLASEGVHQMRVATRRIRAALWAFKSFFNFDLRQEFNREFKWLAGVLGDVRDMDVYQENLRGYVDELPTEYANSLDGYQQLMEEQRNVTRKALTDCLSGERYQTLKSNFSDFLQRGPTADVTTGNEELIHATAKRLIGKRYRSILEEGRSITRESPDAELHELRIECKRLRYLFEFFRPIYGRSLKPYIKSLKALQNVLGEFQDAHVATNQLLEHAQRIPMQTDECRMQLLAIGQLIAGQRRQSDSCRALFHRVWKRFDRRQSRKQLMAILS